MLTNIREASLIVGMLSLQLLCIAGWAGAVEGCGCAACLADPAYVHHNHASGEFHGVTASAEYEPVVVSSAMISTQEARLDAIFSQAAFGDQPIDIRFNPVVEHVAPDLLEVTTVVDQNALLGTDLVSFPGVNLYYVDTLDFCGGFNTGIVGCAHRPGNNIIVESGFAAGSRGAELIGHELGHNLGLPHVTPANLMTGTINGNTMLTVSQVSTIRNSSLVQGSPGDYFIEITPILVVASPAFVPEPVGLSLLALGIATTALLRRRAA